MQMNDFCQRFSTEEQFRKSRLLFIPNEQDRIGVRQFFNCNPLIAKVRMSDCIVTNDFLPSPQKLFLELRQKIENVNTEGYFALVVGFDAIKELWSAENRSVAYENVRNLLDDVNLHFVILANSYYEGSETFQHPRYQEGKIVLRIGDEAVSDSLSRKIYLLSNSLSVIPLPGVHRPSLQEFMRDCEDDTLPEGNVNVSMNFKGGQLAGVSQEVEQIYSKERFLRVFCNLQHNLSQAAVDWLYAKILEWNDLENVLTLAQKYFFPAGINSPNTLKEAPRKVYSANVVEREVLLWMLRLSLEQDSYLAYVLNNRNFVPESFTDFYVCEALNHLRNVQVEELADERKSGLEEIGLDLISGSLATFIKQAKESPIDQVAPWLNCQTLMEKHELVRRLIEMEAWEIPACIFKSYPLLANYMKPYQLGFIDLNNYFTEYRLQKLKDHIREEFYEKVKNTKVVMNGIDSRDARLLTYVNEDSTCRPWKRR